MPLPNRVNGTDVGCWMGSVNGGKNTELEGKRWIPGLEIFQTWV